MTTCFRPRVRLARMVLAALCVAVSPWAGVAWHGAAQAQAQAPAARSAGFAALAASSATASAAAVRVEAVEVELVSDRAAVVPSQPMQLGLRIRHDPQWHTYWRNPGDSGLPTQVELSLPEGYAAGPIVWPAPQRLFIAPLANYGYEGEIVLPMPLSVPATIAGDRVRFTGKASWLMCREVCIPGEAEVALELPVRPGGAAEASRHAALFAQAERRTPRTSIEAIAHVDGERLSIALPGRPSTVEFFPYREGLLRNAAEQVLYAIEGERAGARLELRLTEEGAREAQRGAPAWIAAAEGIVVVDGQVRELALRASEQAFAAGAEISRIAGAPSAQTSATGTGWLAGSGSSSASPSSSLPGGAAAGAPSGPGGKVFAGLAMAALFGAIGGLILNLMPCVFPVIGLKVLGFARYNGEAEASSRLGALAFTAGVVVSFWALAALLLGLRAAGEAAGWGFQLQSPAFVAAMALLFVAIGLNFSGVYEVGLSMTRLGQYEAGEARRHPLLGSFLSGVLAVLVATPCTAPFMGSALGYTLGSTTAEALVVFTSIALGMALPYLLLGFFPSWLGWLPRPGRWMETFRQLLAFPMYATAAWLAWVLGQQAGIDAVFALAIGAVLVGFAAWLHGRFVQAGAPTTGRGARNARPLAATLSIAAVAVALWTAWPVAVDEDSKSASGSAWIPGAASDAGSDTRAGGGADTAGRGQTAGEPGSPHADALAWQEWSSERVREALDAGRPVFVDFTAAWCVTCQANKRLVLEREAVLEAMSQRAVLRLRADWTRRDPAITGELARFGRNGVPLYLLYRPGEAAPQILPELLTTGIVLNALEPVAVAAPSPSAIRPGASSAGL